jgi:hypothetical protein
MKQFGHTVWQVRDHNVTTGKQYLYKFDNGYGASVVPEIDVINSYLPDTIEIMQTQGKLPAAKGEYEVGRLKFINPKDNIGNLDNDVERYLKWKGVNEQLQTIEAMPPHEGFTPKPKNDIIEPPEEIPRFKNLIWILKRRL